MKNSMKKQTQITPSSDLLRHMINPLLAWHRANRRPLPWRKDKNPYRIWLSEIMLQQTRIEAVIPYYHRFLSELPTVEALASVSDEKLMKLWEGLGYYSRARNLKKAAISVITEYGGALPRDFGSLRDLAGIGDYTAGAIASIAYGLPEPAVDGNVLRVIMRLTGREDDIALAATKKKVTEELRAVYPSGEEAGLLTEGLMELGEQICLPNGVPKCEDCPWKDFCVANRDGRQQELPQKSPKKSRRSEDYTVLLLIHNGRLALRKRPEEGLLRGMWELPSLAGHQSCAEIRSFLEEKGLAPRSVVAREKATHIFTHVEWHMIGMIAECDIPSEDYFWFDKEALEQDVALPTAFRVYRKLFLTSFS